MNGNAIRVAIFLAGLLGGVVGDYSCTARKIGELQVKVERNTERTIRIENDVGWIKNFLGELQRARPHGILDDGGGARNTPK